MGKQTNYLSTMQTSLVIRHYGEKKTKIKKADIQISKEDGAYMADTPTNREKMAVSCLDMVKKQANDAVLRLVSNYTEDEYIGYALLGLAEAIDAWFGKDVSYREKMSFSTFSYSYIFKHLTQGVNRDESMISGIPLRERYIESKRATVWADAPMDKEDGETLFDTKIGTTDPPAISDHQARRFKNLWDNILTPNERSALQYTYGIMLPSDYSTIFSNTTHRTAEKVEYMLGCTYTEKHVIKNWVGVDGKKLEKAIGVYTRRSLSKMREAFTDSEMHDLYAYFTDSHKHWSEIK